MWDVDDSERETHAEAARKDSEHGNDADDDGVRLRTI